MKSTGTFAVSLNLVWVKSSYSGAEGGDCVEVATATDTVHVRDSKDSAGAVLSVPRDAWAGFVRLAVRG
jgi:hypothetical protein